MNHDSTGTLYSGRATNWVALGLTTALALPLLLMAGPWSRDSWTAPSFVIPLVIAAAAVVGNLMTLSSLRTLVGANGVSIHFGVFGWPRYRYPLDRIRSIEAVEVPRSWWAWGISWSPRRGLMLTIRNGPALRLTLTNDRKVTISTPHPDDAVRVVAAAPR
ncbi:MAG: hypothetical protein ACSLFP_12210 [Acidimicrobiales bacterium]